MHGEDVVRLRPGGTTTDPYSQAPRPSWETPAEHAVRTLAPAEPRTSSEPTQDARTSVVSGWTLYLPADEDVTAADRFRVRGEVFAVAGEPAAWGGAGLVVQLERTEG